MIGFDVTKLCHLGLNDALLLLAGLLELYNNAAPVDTLPYRMTPFPCILEELPYTAGLSCHEQPAQKIMRRNY